MDIVERLRDWNKFGVSRGDFVAYSHEAADEIEQLRNAVKVQANAVRILHEAEMSELNLLRKNAQEAHTAKATLDSEREANKILTDEIKALIPASALDVNKELLEAAKAATTYCEEIATLGSKYGTLQGPIVSDARSIARGLNEAIAAAD